MEESRQSSSSAVERGSKHSPARANTTYARCEFGTIPADGELSMSWHGVDVIVGAPRAWFSVPAHDHGSRECEDEAP
ncbi:hypothetical protein BIV24_01815 [Streptomyces colonosanans]|uniref:Uncharacterized protein n=1 Tax=Streptomyces colonosanans TaxID=1428652 RepID=A0A1S2Q4E7_9ACTN|nr:hypothetical protein BIV24_01815 [Streptomyces colonosanans]